MKKLFILIVLVSVNLSCQDIINGMFDDMPESVPVCVDSAASSGGDGRGWANAVPGIARALALVKEGGEIWVKEGTYAFAESAVIDGSVENVSIYGGFTGAESGKEERDPSVNVTTLHASGENGTISFSGARSVTLEGFSFTGPGLGDNSAVTIGSSEGIVFRLCTFDSLSGTGNGPAINVMGSGVTIENSIFSNNSNTTTVSYGGALYTDTSNVNIVDSKFLNNGSIYDNNYGGAISVTDTTLNISASEFSNNKVYVNGGALYGEGSTILISNNSEFDNNSAWRGGAIYLTGNSEMTITESDVTNNYTMDYGRNGGAIYLDDTTADIINSTLSRNYADFGSYGGALYIDNKNNEKVNIVNSKFRNNGHNGSFAITLRGGAISLYRGSLTISGTESEISSNCATGSGGGIFSYTDTSLTINETTISNNGFIVEGTPETNSGGGISSMGDSVIINNTVFSNNQTEDTGGGITINSSGTASINACQFVSNSAQGGNGGALLIGNDCAISIVNSLFYNNQVDGGNGGAICFTPSSASLSKTYSNLTFYSNSANGASSVGGAFYSEGGDHTLNNSVFYGNTASAGNNIYSNSGSFTTYYSFYNGGVSGVTSGSNNITGVSTSPFASITEGEDNFLYPNSEIIDKGDNSAISGYSADLGGNTRILNSVVDIGAYEGQ
jgi:predicted outer membrane repeat protein